MTKEWFIIGDIHGSYDKLIKLLSHFDPSKHTLVFVGDYIDKGPDSKRVLETVLHYKTNFNAICLMGNHEQLLLNLIDDSNDKDAFDLWIQNGGDKTLRSFGLNPYKYTPTYYIDYLMKHHSDLIHFLNTLGYYKETDHVIIVHAGIDFQVNDWRTSTQSMLWTREFFHFSPNTTDKTIVFGHTPTVYFNEDHSSDIWVSNDNKIGIDGGAVFNGHLHGLTINKNGSITNIYSV